MKPPLPRRTFAIISHPDAGKTTLTEKFLLYGGAVQLAGSVTARRNQRATSSDWMELEKQRGISVSSTVLQFEYGGTVVNLLDTPGHRDFSEDTYRVLTAVDSVIMVIDAAKGIEPQTRKLFEVCRQRHIPIFTFMNKLDRPTRDPLALLDELHEVLELDPFAMNWPIGTGPDFRGIFDRGARQVHLFERTAGGASMAREEVGMPEDPHVRSRAGDALLSQMRDEIEMLEHAGTAFDEARILGGLQTPVFFGSAMNNFGVRLLLDGFLRLASPPMPRPAGDRVVRPEDPAFTGFVFKIQANMDPRHRDRIAFVRVVSGRFEREMTTIHAQSGRRVRISSAQKLFGQDRETVDEAFPGDVIGLIGQDRFAIGDTLTDDREIVFDPLPRFAPECFAYLHNPQTSNSKRFRLGMEQLLQEGVVQTLRLDGDRADLPLLAAVGPLQFEVVQYRLESEYGAPSRLEKARWTVGRWLARADAEKLRERSMPESAALAVDGFGDDMILFTDEWSMGYFLRNNPGLALHTTPPGRPITAVTGA